MAEEIKVLGQSKPVADTLTAVYTCPSGKSAVVSTITVCNQNASERTFRLSIAVAGAADDTKQYLYYDQPVAGYSTFALTLGITLGAADIVRGYASDADLSFNVFGSEVDA